MKKPPKEELKPKRLISVYGREEHEAMLKEPWLLHALGMDPVYENMVYLKQWGNCGVPDGIERTEEEERKRHDTLVARVMERNKDLIQKLREEKASEDK